MNSTCAFVAYTLQSDSDAYQQSPTTYEFVCERVHQFRLRPREFSLALEHLHRNIDLALLQAELRQCRDGSLALWVHSQRLLAAPLCRTNVLLPLVHRQTLVHLRQNVARGRSKELSVSGRHKRPSHTLWPLVLDLNGPVELVHCFLEPLLIEKQLSAAPESAPITTCQRELTSSCSAHYGAGTPSASAGT